MHGQGFDLGLLLLVVAVWAAAVGGAVWAAAHIIQRSRPQPPALPSPLDLLERRYAAGEISHEAFDEARARLREYQIDL